MAPRVKQIASQARHGAFRTMLPRLRELATGANTRLPERWQGAAAAVTIMFWLDEFTAAADLTEELIGRDGHTRSGLDKQDYPFDMALLAADLHTGVSAGPRLRRLSGSVAAGSVLQQRLTWLAGALDQRPVAELLPNAAPWDADPSPLDGVTGAEYLTADYASLSRTQQRALWNALRRTSQFDRAWQLYQQTGQLPPYWAVCVWLSGGCATRGQDLDARQVLLAAHPQWWPYADWDCLPPDPVLHPVLVPRPPAAFGSTT